jgi:DNA repair protein RadC
MQLREITEYQKPREKFIHNGVEFLSEIELLALILNSGSKHKDVLHLAHNIYALYESKKRAPHKNELKQIQGVGDIKAMQICALFELAKRLPKQKMNGKSMTTASKIYEYTKHEFDQHREEFHILLLDTQLRAIGYKKIFSGTLDSITIHPREVFATAIEHLAHSIILLHNHPSNNPEPSDADIHITKKFITVGDIIGIPVLDHIIVTQSNYYSFSQHNLM